MKYAKVEGYDNLLRDCNTNAIINTNKSEYENYIRMKEEKINSNTKIEIIENQLQNLKSDILEIKQILKQLLK